MNLKKITNLREKIHKFERNLLEKNTNSEKKSTSLRKNICKIHKSRIKSTN